MQKDITVDGHSFLTEWAWAHTEQQFIDEFKGMDHIFPETDNKTAKLKEAYAMILAEKPKDWVAPKALKAVPSAPASSATGAANPAEDKK